MKLFSRCLVFAVLVLSKFSYASNVQEAKSSQTAFSDCNTGEFSNGLIHIDEVLPIDTLKAYGLNNNDNIKDIEPENARALIIQLNKENLIEADTNGSLRLKKPVLENLRNLQRISTETALGTSICN